MAQEAKKVRNIELVDKACAGILAINPNFWFARELPKHMRGYYAQIGQDTIIEKFFLDHPAESKIFVDVGAFDGVHYSNVRRLHEQYGWTGICVEPVRNNYEKLAHSYSETLVKCIRAAVSDVEGEMEINVATYPHLPEWGSDIATFSANEMKRWKQYDPEWQKELVPVQTLTAILDQQGIQCIDFLSIDTEGNDLEVLQSLDFSRFYPSLIIVEYGSNREEIYLYLIGLGYSLLLDNSQDLLMTHIDLNGPFLSKQPKFKTSAIVSTYNSERFMRHCLQDLVEQTLYKSGELEIIIIDSNSEQNEQAIIQEFQARYPNIFYVRTLERKTLYSAWNHGIQVAHGQYITNANTDDRHRPDALEIMANYLDVHPGVALVYADQLITTTANDTWATTQADRCWNWPFFSYTELERRCIVGPQPMWRKSLHEKYGYFRSEFTCAGDYEFWLRISKTESIVRLPEILGLYYDNSQSLEHASQNSWQETYRVWDEYGILQRGVIHTSSIPTGISPSELNALPYRTNLQSLISIIIPCYNHAKYLKEAIESVINQTYQNWECIVVNDGSTDNTSDVARDLINLHKNKKIYLVEKVNDGVVNSRNVGVTQSSGKLILFLDADDKIHPDFLKETIVVLVENPRIGFVYTDVQKFGVKYDLVSHGDFSPERFLSGNQAPVSSLFRREIYDQTGGFKGVMELGWEDWEFWISAYEQGWQGYRLGKPYLFYRQHYSGSRLQILESSLLSQALQKAKIINLHTKLYSQDEVLWANQILHQHTKFLAIRSYSASIIVPWWDHSELLELWERNLAHLPDTEIIFIDNGSGPETKADLLEFCTRHKIRLIRNEENQGFSAANNQGAEVATGDHVLFLNDDVEILIPPVSYLCSLAGNGIAGPGPVQNEIGQAYIEGWALCIRKSTLRALKGWCEDYGPGYWDDVDLCYRAELAGYPVIPVPDMNILIHHLGNTTGRDGRLDQLALHFRNRATFIEKYYKTFPKFIIDGVFFQLYKTGIARVWRSLLEEWLEDSFSKYLVILDRAGTAPKISGIRYRLVPAYDYNNTDSDRAMLQQVCDEEGADLFISTYYTTPISTPSVFMAYDMIPEVVGADLNTQRWREKHHGIQHASAYVAISENTARDLVTSFPDVSSESITIAHCGVQRTFSPADSEVVSSFKARYGISKPYFVLVGAESGQKDTYKNTILFFKAFSKLYSRQAFDVICTGGGLLEDELRVYTSGSTIHMLQLNDDELRTAYSGAVALVYPSKYEGFGLPVLEAIACGCPVITCPNASIPEVAGEAALYVNDEDVDGLANALCDVQKPSLRNSLIAAGLAQAKKFSWSKMASTVSSALINATLLPFNLKGTNLIVFPDWSQPEDSLSQDLASVIRAVVSHPDKSDMTLLIDTSGISDEDANLALSAAAMNLLLEEDLDVSDGPEISLLAKLGETQWEALLPRIQARISLENENKQAIAQAKAENIPSCELASLRDQQAAHFAVEN